MTQIEEWRAILLQMRYSQHYFLPFPHKKVFYSTKYVSERYKSCNRQKENTNQNNLVFKMEPKLISFNVDQ